MALKTPDTRDLQGGLTANCHHAGVWLIHLGGELVAGLNWDSISKSYLIAFEHDLLHTDTVQCIVNFAREIKGGA